MPELKYTYEQIKEGMKLRNIGRYISSKAKRAAEVAKMETSRGQAYPSKLRERIIG
tara:strand:+ start:302 stop:469 length:168 start_codon:yes stop_codon:yes gene_type:complete